jgi:N-methylhydantoinase A/oxoprolinase/acetone carboxylase beta subunit
MLKPGVDVGGTFTDVCLLDAESGQVWMEKLPSTPHDQSLAELAAEVAPSAMLFPSSSISPEYREYWRMGTRAVNAYAVRPVCRYIDRVEQRLREDIVAPRTLVTRSSGGGGWGDPRRRDPAAVETDLRDGYIAPGHAHDAYGWDGARREDRRGKREGGPS